MPINLTKIRSRRATELTLANQATTTNLDTTTPIDYSAINVAKYNELAIVTSVLANSTGAPYVQLLVSANGSSGSFAVHSTIHPDLTTTANADYHSVTNFGNYVKVRLVNATTSANIRFKVSAVGKT
jgi:hypothetical protein